jgi:hypothetical protein
MDPAYDLNPHDAYFCTHCKRRADHYSPFCAKNPDPNSIYQQRQSRGILGEPPGVYDNKDWKKFTIPFAPATENRPTSEALMEERIKEEINLPPNHDAFLPNLFKTHKSQPASRKARPRPTAMDMWDVNDLRKDRDAQISPSVGVENEVTTGSTISIAEDVVTFMEQKARFQWHGDNGDTMDGDNKLPEPRPLGMSFTDKFSAAIDNLEHHQNRVGLHEKGGAKYEIDEHQWKQLLRHDQKVHVKVGNMQSSETISGISSTTEDESNDESEHDD